MKAYVIADPEFVAAIQARSVRAPERDTPGGVECWREGSKEHYFIDGAYWRTDCRIPVK